MGVLFFSLRLVWAGTADIRSAAPGAAGRSGCAGHGQRASRSRMKLARPVRVLISAAADCPSVVGWIRPAVLLPAATVLGLTPQQLEAVLAHELAHILRYDYLVNMLQSVVETLLFYHPGGVVGVGAHPAGARAVLRRSGGGFLRRRAVLRARTHPPGKAARDHAKLALGQRGRTVAVSHSAARRAMRAGSGGLPSCRAFWRFPGPDLFRAEHAVGPRPAAGTAPAERRPRRSVGRTIPACTSIWAART